MDTVTSLLGNKIFASLYDPKSDKLAADFRAKAANSLTSLTKIVSNGDATKNMLDKIPGVSDTTKTSLDLLLKEAKSYTSAATTNLTPNAIAAKKDEVAAKIKALVRQAKSESVTTKEKEKANEAKATHDKIANQTTSGQRFLKNTLTYVLYTFLGITLLALALWGASLASNSAINLPLYMRVYYLIYGFLLFPVPIFLSFGKTVTYHAILAPLIEKPAEPTAFTNLMSAFVYIPGIPPQEVTVTTNPVAVAQTNILKTIAAEAPSLGSLASVASATPSLGSLASVASAAPSLDSLASVASAAPSLTKAIVRKPSVGQLMGLLSKNAGLIKTGV